MERADRGRVVPDAVSALNQRIERRLVADVASHVLDALVSPRVGRRWDDVQAAHLTRWRGGRRGSPAPTREGCTAAERASTAPRSTSISTSRAPTKPVPPVTTQTRGTAARGVRLAAACTGLRWSERSGICAFWDAAASDGGSERRPKNKNFALRARDWRALAKKKNFYCRHTGTTRARIEEYACFATGMARTGTNCSSERRMTRSNLPFKSLVSAPTLTFNRRTSP